MQIRFAEQRPSGSFALILPAGATERGNLSSLGDERAAVEAAARAQRFEGEMIERMHVEAAERLLAR